MIGTYHDFERLETCVRYLNAYQLNELVLRSLLQLWTNDKASRTDNR